ALDEKQSEVIASASNELARRKGDLEVNLNLLNDLTATEHEKHIFTTSLLEILAEFGALPHATNASALTNSIKHLHDQLQLSFSSSRAKLAELNSMIENNAIIEAPGLGPTGSHPPSSSTGMQGSSQLRSYAANRNMEPSAGPPLYMQVEDPSRVTLGTIRLREMASSLDMISDRLIKFHITASDEYPWIYNFQIDGIAKPGCEITGCGVPKGGTYLCMFQWVRHNPDGTTEFIDGATYPTYVVTADDVDKLIAVECIPMDEHGRHGNLVRMFANDNKKITCDDEMQEEIDSYVSKGSATFPVLVILDSSENWEPASIVLRRSGYQVKVEKKQEPLISEKYSKELSIKIPSGLSAQFVLTCSDGSLYPFSMNDDVRMRDTLVLTMRIFQMKAVNEKRKGMAA
ncbi:hypothetical protein M569_01668, partial [Genlisea aurea]